MTTTACRAVAIKMVYSPNCSGNISTKINYSEVVLYSKRTLESFATLGSWILRYNENLASFSLQDEATEWHD